MPQREHPAFAAVLACVPPLRPRAAGLVAITLVIAAAVAILALRSTTVTARERHAADAQLAGLLALRDDARSLARDARRYVLEADLAARDRSRERAAQLRAAATTWPTLERRLLDYAIALERRVSAPPAPSTIAGFEAELELVREPLGRAFAAAQAQLQQRARSAQVAPQLVRVAQAGLVLVLLLVVGLAVVALLPAIKLRARAVTSEPNVIAPAIAPAIAPTLRGDEPRMLQ